MLLNIRALTLATYITERDTLPGVKSSALQMCSFSVKCICQLIFVTEAEKVSRLFEDSII